MEHKCRDNDRQRYGRQRDNAGAEIPEKQKQHDDDPDRSVADRFFDVLDGDGDEVRLPENVLLDIYVRGERALDVVQRLEDVAIERERVGARLLLNRENHGRLRVYAAVAARHRTAESHVRDLPHRHRYRVPLPHDGVFQVLERQRPAHDADQRFLAGRQQKAAAGDGIRFFDRSRQLIDRHFVLSQALGRSEHLELTQFTPHHHDLRNAVDRE